MKIKKFNESLSDETETKFYVYSVNSYDTTYRGSIWDNPRKAWLPFDATLVGEFKLSKDKTYMVVDQQELDEINKIKEELKIQSDSKKYNI